MLKYLIFYKFQKFKFFGKKANAPVNNFLMCAVRECTKIMIRKVFERVSTDNSRGWMHDQNTFDGLFIQLL